MATAFRFLGAKPDPRRQGQRNGQGEIQTGRLQGILSIQKGVIRAGGGWRGSRWSTGTGCRQKTALCLQVTFDAKVIPARVKLRILLESWEVEVWPRRAGLHEERLGSEMRGEKKKEAVVLLS